MYGDQSGEFVCGYWDLKGQEGSEKYEYCSTVPRTFVQDCSYSELVSELGHKNKSRKYC